MAFWLALAGMGAGAIGAEQNREATVEGAQTQAEIEKLNRDVQQKRFDRDIEYQQPLMDIGKGNLQNLKDANKNQYDITQSPLYKMQEKMIMSELGDAPEDVKSDALKQLGAREGELTKGRFLDLQKIGQGAAGSAGTTAINFGSAFADSMSRQGGALANATLSGDMQRQNMWTTAAEDLSGYPALREQNQYIGRRRANQYESSPDFVGPPNPYR